ncbi:ThuA domain-containing protein [Kineococcus sp. G2]|uniref:ThuA domain-containing protein n=1 Tax=Kineococcus sp. G2 TaxID=3127484 RepID=UPI00301B7159
MSAAQTTRALVLVGRGRYQDRWHDDAATGHRVAAVLAEVGLEPELRGTAPDALDATDGLGLLVVVAGTGRVEAEWDGGDQVWAPFHARLAALVAEGGVPLLALHQAANTFTDTPGWADLVGGRWVPERSMHPPIGPALFRPVPGEEHPVVAGLGPVEAFDERYCLLETAPTARVLLTTDHEGTEHPVVWQAGGPGRVLYDGLGHDTRSYDSPSRRELLRREVAWLRGEAP